MKSKNNVFHVFCFLIAITNVKVIHAWLARIVAEDMAASFSYHTALWKSHYQKCIITYIKH